MFNKTVLEVSLKPFKQLDEESLSKTVFKIFEQWKPLIKNREEICILLWVADGSEILDYRGNLDDSFEYCKYIGTANKPLATVEDEQNGVSLHKKKRLYSKDCVTWTYRDLKNLLFMIKRVGEELFPTADITVTETFDLGPEFAESSFKYERHSEICLGSVLDGKGFLDATAVLKGDNYRYASYKNGIPDGTPFATFLGKQVKAFFSDIPFDSIWLSNGLGFSSNPWDVKGKIFDGKDFYSDKLKQITEQVFNFWKLFSLECPNLRIETRGTNNTVGIDYATDGVPLYDIYDSNLNIVPPPNSPWAAINGNYGLELFGHMTRICELPKSYFLFRYYLHDPWWMNSPWYDRYEGYPGDIYLPMSICRVNEYGKVETASQFNVLTVDNSYGEMPESCVNEVLPHLLKAEKDAPTDMSFAVLVYPLKEYTKSTNAEELREMYYSDLYMCNAINSGLPLNTVISTDNFLKINVDKLKGKIIVIPYVNKNEIKDKIKELLNNGIKIISYGTKKVLYGYNFKHANFVKVDINGKRHSVNSAFAKFGYKTKFITKQKNSRLPIYNVSKTDGGLFFNVENLNTTTKTAFRYPLGAPIMFGCEAEIKNGYSVYGFARSEHRECRVFIKQKSGVVSCREIAPVSANFRRKIGLYGLKNAEVCFFGEEYCRENVTVSLEEGDMDPVYDSGWEKITDEYMGVGYRKKNVCGNVFFLLPMNK